MAPKKEPTIYLNGKSPTVKKKVVKKKIEPTTEIEDLYEDVITGNGLTIAATVEGYKEYKKIFPDTKQIEYNKITINYFEIKRIINNIKFIGTIKRERFKIYQWWNKYCNWWNNKFNDIANNIANKELENPYDEIPYEELYNEKITAMIKKDLEIYRSDK